MKRLTSVLPYLICAVALGLLLRELNGVSVEQLWAEVRARGAGQLGAALGLLVVNFAVMGLYDLIALRQLNERLPLGVVLVTGIQSFAVTNLVSHSIVTGLAMRARAYGRFGLKLSKLTQITVMNVETWWIGFIFLFGLVLVSTPLDDLREYSRFLTMGGGAALLGLGVVYLLGCTLMSGRVVRWGRFEIFLPSLESALQKAIVGAVDTTLVSLTLFALMPSDLPLTFPHFLALHLIAHSLGVITMVPGGLGVLEGVLLELLEPYGTKSAILASILLFRVVHYLLPASLSILWMSARDLRARRAALTKPSVDQ